MCIFSSLFTDHEYVYRIYHLQLNMYTLPYILMNMSLLYIRKAYDPVNHKMLLKKLSFCGVRGIQFGWFASYLENRSQYVAKYLVTMYSVILIYLSVYIEFIDYIALCYIMFVHNTWLSTRKNNK